MIDRPNLEAVDGGVAAVHVRAIVAVEGDAEDRCLERPVGSVGDLDREALPAGQLVDLLTVRIEEPDGVQLQGGELGGPSSAPGRNFAGRRHRSVLGFAHGVHVAADDVGGVAHRRHLAVVDPGRLVADLADGAHVV